MVDGVSVSCVPVALPCPASGNAVDTLEWCAEGARRPIGWQRLAFRRMQLLYVFVLEGLYVKCLPSLSTNLSLQCSYVAVVKIIFFVSGWRGSLELCLCFT